MSIRWLDASISPNGTIVAQVTRVSGNIVYYNPGTFASPPSGYNITAGHRYTVLTEYWWNDGGQWSSVSAWTNSYSNVGIWSDPQVVSNNGCVA